MTTTSYSFTDIVDFTRATAATYVNSSGLVTVTPASKNTLTYSQSFANWTQARVTVAANVTTAPNGQVLASKLTDNSENSTHMLTITPTSPVAGGLYTFSVYVKKNTYPYVYLNFYNASNAWVSAVFNLDTATVTQTGVGTSTNVALAATNITNEGSGWYRISLTGVITSSTIATAGIGFAQAATGNTFTTLGLINYSGNGTNSFYVWGAQLESTSYDSLTLGTERVVGGNFESGLVGSIQDGGSPASVSTYTINTVSPISGTQDGKVTITTATTGGYPRISIPNSSSKTIGAVYLLSFDYVVLSGAMKIEFVFNGASTTSPVSSTSYTGSGKFQVLYTARGTNANDGIYFGNSVCTVQIDNISAKQVTGLTGYPTSYTKNFGSIYPPRFDYDPVTLQPKGFLIEESRTNSLTYSSLFDNVIWTKTALNTSGSPSWINTAISPDGTMNADTIIPDTTLSTHSISRPSITFNDATTYTISVFVKPAGYNYFSISVDSAVMTARYELTGNGAAVATTGGLSTNASATITNIGNGWYRCTATFTKSGTQTKTIIFSVNQTYSVSEVFTGDGTSGIFIWGAQLEAGAFATSYIPTVTSTVTRNADVANVSGVNFSTWNNPARGTILIDMDLTGVPPPNFQAFTLGTSSNAIFIRIVSTGISDLVYFDGPSVASLSVLATAPVTNTRYKNALAYSTNDFAGVLNGGTVLTDSSGNVPIATSCSIGNNGESGSVFNGHIRLMRYYPTRLTNAQIQALTV